MPELPEVQTIVSELETVLPGLKIRDVWSDFSKIWIFEEKNEKLTKKNTSVAQYKKELGNKKIINVERKGKNIFIHLSDNLTILVHQKMTGHLLYGKWEFRKNEKHKWISKTKGPLTDDPDNRFIHLVFHLSNGYQLALCDMRKFAKIMIGPSDKFNKLKEIQEIGPDPFDKNFSFQKFLKIFEEKREKIKIALMDQKNIAGIGNIYADEILWKAGVHPTKKIPSLTKDELKKIYQSIKPVLQKAIKMRGSSYVDYRDAFGYKGKYQEMHYAYQMTGTKCQKKDGGIIKKIKVNGRGTHFCPIHQKS